MARIGRPRRGVLGESTGNGGDVGTARPRIETSGFRRPTTRSNRHTRTTARGAGAGGGSRAWQQRPEARRPSVFPSHLLVGAGSEAKTRQAPRQSLSAFARLERNRACDDEGRLQGAVARTFADHNRVRLRGRRRPGPERAPEDRSSRRARRRTGVTCCAASISGSVRPDQVIGDPPPLAGIQMAASNSKVWFWRSHSSRLSSSMRLRPRPVRPPSSFGQHQGSIGVGERQRTQQGGVGQREDRAVGADAEREGQRRDDGEPRRPFSCRIAKLHVVPELLEPLSQRASRDLAFCRGRRRCASAARRRQAPPGHLGAPSAGPCPRRSARACASRRGRRARRRLPVRAGPARATSAVSASSRQQDLRDAGRGTAARSADSAASCARPSRVRR